MDLQSIVALAVSGKLRGHHRDLYCSAGSHTADDCYNQAALRIAQFFDAKSMSFAEADTAMNAIYALMIDDAAKAGDGFTLAEPAFSIYEAIDAGEYDHGDGCDPVEKHTRPAIKTILGHT